MASFHLRTRDGKMRSITARDGLSVMEAIRRAGIFELEATCGGSCSCATCHVYVEQRFEPNLPAISDMESDLLETSEHRTTQSRLSCQIFLMDALDGMTVIVAPAD